MGCVQKCCVCGGVLCVVWVELCWHGVGVVFPGPLGPWHEAS